MTTAALVPAQDLCHPVDLFNGELTFKVIWIETQILLFHFSRLIFNKRLCQMPYFTPTAAPRGHQSYHVGGGAGGGVGSRRPQREGRAGRHSHRERFGATRPRARGSGQGGQGGARGLAASEPELRWVRKTVSTLTSSVVLIQLNFRLEYVI